MKCFFCEKTVKNPFVYRPGKGRGKVFCPDDPNEPLDGSTCFENWLAEKTATTRHNRQRAAREARRAGKISPFGRPFGKQNPRPDPNPQIAAIDQLLDLLRDMGQNILIEDVQTEGGAATMIRIAAAETALNAARRLLLNKIITPTDIFRERGVLINNFDPGDLTGMQKCD